MRGPTPGSTPFEALLFPVLHTAYGYALSLTRSGPEAEDLVQEAALAAYKGFASFLPGTNFKAWFFRILTNCHFARYRRAQRRPATVELDDSQDLDLYLFRRTAEAGLHEGGDDPAGRLLRKLTAEQVQHAVAALPDEFRTVVSLFFLEDFTYDEIAAVAGCPLGTVRSRLHRGRKMLQKHLWTTAVEAGVVSPPGPAGSASP